MPASMMKWSWWMTICISVVAPTTLIHTRYLCAKLRGHFAGLKIVVGLWGRTGLTPEVIEGIRASGTDEIVTTLAEALRRLSVPEEPRTSETGGHSE